MPLAQASEKNTPPRSSRALSKSAAVLLMAVSLVVLAPLAFGAFFFGALWIYGSAGGSFGFGSFGDRSIDPELWWLPLTLVWGALLLLALWTSVILVLRAATSIRNRYRGM